jgi:hypothetical protein
LLAMIATITNTATLMSRLTSSDKRGGGTSPAEPKDNQPLTKLD